MKPNIVATLEAPSTQHGAIVYWTMSGNTEVGTLREALADIGVAEKRCPDPSSPARALRRACRKAAQGSLILDRHPSGGWVFVSRDASAGELNYAAGLHVTAGPDGVEFVGAGEHTGNLQRTVRDLYEQNLTVLTAQDVSYWLTGYVLKECSGVRLRETGGFYFVPPGPSMDVWRVASRTVRECGRHETHEIPAVTSTADAVEAICSALQAEVDAFIEATSVVLDDEPGKRALKRRTRLCSEMLKKSQVYSDTLGVQLDGVDKRLEELMVRSSELLLEAQDG